MYAPFIGISLGQSPSALRARTGQDLSDIPQDVMHG